MYTLCRMEKPLTTTEEKCQIQRKGGRKMDNKGKPYEGKFTNVGTQVIPAAYQRPTTPSPQKSTGTDLRSGGKKTSK